MRSTLLVLVMACGGGDDAGEPLVAGNVDASFDGDDFRPAFGFATPYQDRHIIVLGDGPVHCGTEMQDEPPPGRTVVIAIDALTPGTFGGVLVQVFRNDDEFEGVGSNDGSVSLDTVGDTVAGSISYNYVDDEARVFSASGAFEVRLCN